MSEETKKTEQIEQDAKSTELSDQDLDQVAGGGGSQAAAVAAPRVGGVAHVGGSAGVATPPKKHGP